MSKSPDHDLVSLRSDFQLWRGQRLHREPIPERLWRRALALLTSYPQATICRELKLNPTRFKQRLQAFAPVHRQQPRTRASFIEVCGSDLSLPPQHPSPESAPADREACVRFIVERADGFRLHIESPVAHSSSLQALCSALLRS